MNRCFWTFLLVMLSSKVSMGAVDDNEGVLNPAALPVVSRFAPAPLLDIDYVMAARHCASQSYAHADAVRDGRAVEIHLGVERWQAHPFRRAGASQRESHMGFVYRHGKRMVIAYHGSDYIRDWVNDFKLFRTDASSLGLEGRVHTGFYGLIQETQESLLKAIREAQAGLDDLEAGEDFEYLVTGHSLGGALAILGSAGLVLDGSIFTGGRALPNQVRCISFSAPNVGDGVCTSHIHRILQQHNILCYSNKFDTVTHVPPTLGGFYASVGTRIEYELFDHFIETSQEAVSGIPDLRPQEVMEGAVGAGVLSWLLKPGKKGLKVLASLGGAAFFMHKATAADHVRKKHLECISIARRLEDIRDFSEYYPKHVSSDLGSWVRSFF